MMSDFDDLVRELDENRGFLLGCEDYKESVSGYACIRKNGKPTANQVRRNS